jgi:hypothetical protein
MLCFAALLIIAVSVMSLLIWDASINARDLRLREPQIGF